MLYWNVAVLTVHLLTLCWFDCMCQWHCLHDKLFISLPVVVARLMLLQTFCNCNLLRVLRRELHRRSALATLASVFVCVCCFAVFCIVCFFWDFFTFVAFFPSVLWYCWLGLLTCKTVSQIAYTVLVETLNPAHWRSIVTCPPLVLYLHLLLHYGISGCWMCNQYMLLRVNLCEVRFLIRKNLPSTLLLVWMLSVHFHKVFCKSCLEVVLCLCMTRIFL